MTQEDHASSQEASRGSSAARDEEASAGDPAPRAPEPAPQPESGGPPEAEEDAELGLAASLMVVAERLEGLAREDEELRRHLRRLAVFLEEMSAEPEVEPAPPEPASRERLAPTTSLAEMLEERARQRDAVQAARLQAEEEASHAALAERSRRTGPPEVDEREVPLIVKRCRLKAEGARWVVDRQRRLARGADHATEIEPVDRELIARARELPDCFLWVQPTAPPPASPPRLEDLAESFDALADALEVVLAARDRQEERPDVHERALDLVAESQSALRSAVSAVHDAPDRDQRLAHWWLKREAATQHVWLSRHVRSDDPADPTRWADLRERISELDEEVQSDRHARKRERQLLNRLRYHVGQVEASPRDDHDHDWRRIVESTDGLVAAGLPPSSVEIREMLLPLVDDLPDTGEDLPQGFRLVLREIDRFVARQPVPAAPPAEGEPPAELAEARALLRGRAALLVGGACRPAARRALEEAFELSELLWPDSHEHQSVTSFEPLVARPEVAVVFLAIRWSSHSFGELKHACDRHGKPLVRLPAGYHPNQVARQLVTQVSEQLRSG